MIDLFLQWSKKPFAFGSTDCCQFVAACLEYRTGRNYARQFSYAGKRGARNLIDKYHGMDGLLTSLFGVPHASGRDGDVALLDDDEIVGYVHNNRIVTRADGTGLIDLPLSRASRFWHE